MNFQDILAKESMTELDKKRGIINKFIFVFTSNLGSASENISALYSHSEP